MTLLDMKKKVLGLIEEMNPDSEFLTDDPDISAKLNEVINQVMFELCRFKKIPRYVEIPVAKGTLLDFEAIGRACGYDVYQIDTVGGVSYDLKAGGTMLKILEDGTAEVDVFVYPERISENTRDKVYEFELSADALEVMPFGVASDLLKSDVSTQYGRIYSERYELMLQRLDSRYSMSTFSIEGGVAV